MNVAKGYGKDSAADGLRGAAAIAVVFCHFFIAFFPLGFVKIYPGSATDNAKESIITDILSAPLISFLWNGTLAVSIFFVLSGYVLIKAFNETGDVNILKARAAKRLFRFFLPVLFSVMLSWLVLELGVGYWKDASNISGSWWLNHFWSFEPSFESAIKEGFYGAIFNGRSLYTPPLWTMKIELVGSFIVFSYSALKLKGMPEIILLFVVSLLLISYANREAVYYIAFIVGAYISKVKYKPGRMMGLALLVCSVYFGGYDSSRLYSWIRYILGNGITTGQTCSVIAGWIVVFLVSKGYFGGVLNSKVFQLFGKLSFSIYLTHFPIILSLSSFIYVLSYSMNIGYAGIAANLAITLIVVFFVSYLFMKLFDETSSKIANYLIKN